MLLVDHHQPEVGDRGEDGRARPDRDARLPRTQPPPLVVALALRQGGVQERDHVAEARPEAADGLRGERDLRDEDDRAAPPRQGLGDRAQVDLRLPRARHPVQEERLACVRGRLDRRERRGLRRVGLDLAVGLGVDARSTAARARADGHDAAGLEAAQHRKVGARGRGEAGQDRALAVGQPRVRGARERLGPQRRLGPAFRGQHQRERARRRRAVLLGHPQRQLHEVRRARLRVDADRRDEAVLGDLAALREPGHHAAQGLPAEGDPDHRADLKPALRDQVVEGSLEPPRGGQRLDLGDAGHVVRR